MFKMYCKVDSAKVFPPSADGGVRQASLNAGGFLSEIKPFYFLLLAIYILTVYQHPALGNYLPASDTSQSNPSNKPSDQRFLLTGLAYVRTVVDGTKFNSASIETELKPVFLWKPTAKLFFESQIIFAAGMGNKFSNSSVLTNSGGHNHRLERSFVSILHDEPASPQKVSVTNNTKTADILLKYSHLTYLFTPQLSVSAGLFLSPFGIFPEHLYPEWSNKFSSAPLGFGFADQMTPETELGLQIRGNFNLKNSGINYALGISNGPALIESGTNAGKLDFENLADNNASKALTARMGFLPWNSNTFEIGLSSQSAKVGKKGSPFEGVDARLLAGDISYSKNINPLKGTVELKAQYTYIALDKVYYKAVPTLTLNVPAKDVNLKDSAYRFDNKSELYFISFAYRPVTDNNFWKNSEYVLRYDVLNLPLFALWGKDKTRFTGGFLYWFSDRSCLKLNYEYESSGKLLALQWVMGL